MAAKMMGTTIAVTLLSSQSISLPPTVSFMLMAVTLLSSQSISLSPTPEEAFIWLWFIFSLASMNPTLGHEMALRSWDGAGIDAAVELSEAFQGSVWKFPV